MPCAIWYRLYNLKNVQFNVLQLATLLKATLLHGSFSLFQKFYKRYQIAQTIFHFCNARLKKRSIKGGIHRTPTSGQVKMACSAPHLSHFSPIQAWTIGFKWTKMTSIWS